MFRSTKQKRTAQAVFGIYCLLLVWLVLFRFATSPSDLPRFRGISFIPFSYARETSTHLKEVVYNLMAFVPLGVYLTIFREAWSPVRKCICIALTSLAFETAQFVFAIGAGALLVLLLLANRQ